LIDHIVNDLIDKDSYYDEDGVLHGEKSIEEREEILRNHIFLKREIQKEMDDYQILIETPILTTEFVRQFRYSANPNEHGIVSFSE
jgi:hypothetical protein